MAGFSIFLIFKEKKVESLELRAFSLQVNNTVEGILRDNIDNEKRITNISKIKKELVKSSSVFTYLGTEVAIFTGDYNLFFNTMNNWLCSYTEYSEGNRNFIGYGYLDPKTWFTDKEIAEIENYLYADLKAKKVGDLSEYSLNLEGFWVDNEMIIPDKISVTPMYAQSFDEKGSVTSSGGTHENNIAYITGNKNTKDLQYFKYGGILPISNDYHNSQKEIELRNIASNKEKLKETIKKTGNISIERVNFFTYRYYLAQPYQNIKQVIDEGNNYSEFWTVFVREVNLLDKCFYSLVFIWGSCLIAFIILSFILSEQTYKTYSKREEFERQQKETTNALAHDLKTPLSIISGYAQNLLENIHTKKREYYAGNILDNINRMDKIIQEMLELSKLESGLFEIRFEAISLAEVCTKIINRYGKICNERYIITSLEGDAILKADTYLIERVIDNFFVNALDNTPLEGIISIRIFNSTLEFYNSGSYIPEEMLSEIWQPYKKADISRNNTKGTGLGLSISRTILELYNFTYGAKNSDNGVVFWYKW
jgi:signal transduction histidine kinase